MSPNLPPLDAGTAAYEGTRTCLKEVPNNLIFHLKRFDFDLRTMQRSKINDYFEFPHTIDMRPYKIQQLSEPQLSTPEDLFELVGVLVHSGTAESGHYYSFIRERPITGTSQSPDWVQYNDAEVQCWDPSNIAAQCFGGTETWPQARDSQPIVLPKSYSAYMLFYQRSSSIKQEQSHHDQQRQGLSVAGPKKQPVSLELSNHIALENELFIRKYCLYDEYHSLLVRWVFDSLRQINHGVCSESHVMERDAMNMALNHVEQVMARTKEVPYYDEMMSSILRSISSCGYCPKLALNWVAAYPEATRNLLCRCPTTKVRQEFSRMISVALRELREKRPSLYGIDASSTKVSEIEENEGAVFDVLDQLNGFWDLVEINLRSWDDYFGLLTHIASFGSQEAIIILHKGFLRRCLELVIADSEPTLRIQYERLLRAFAKGRKASYSNVIELISILLQVIDLSNRSYMEDEDDRFHAESHDTLPLTRGEAYLMKLLVTRTKNIIFLQKLLDLNHNMEGTLNIIAQLTRAEPAYGMLSLQCKTLLAGIEIEPASLAGPFLQAVITTCENAPAPADIKDLVARTSKDVDTIGMHGGREHLQFFRALTVLRNNRWPQQPHYFRYRVLEHIKDWAPPLLLYWDSDIREETEALLHHILFDHGIPASTTLSTLNEAMDRAGRDLGQACLSKLHERYTESSVQVERKLLESIYRVITECRAYYIDDDADYDSKRESKFETTNYFPGHVRLLTFGPPVVLNSLRELVTEEADDLASGTQSFFVPESSYISYGIEEWDNESNAASDSSEIDANLQGESASP